MVGKKTCRNIEIKPVHENVLNVVLHLAATSLTTTRVTNKYFYL